MKLNGMGCMQVAAAGVLCMRCHIQLYLLLPGHGPDVPRCSSCSPQMLGLCNHLSTWQGMHHGGSTPDLGAGQLSLVCAGAMSSVAMGALVVPANYLLVVTAGFGYALT